MSSESIIENVFYNPIISCFDDKPNPINNLEYWCKFIIDLLRFAGVNPSTEMKIIVKNCLLLILRVHFVKKNYINELCFDSIENDCYSKEELNNKDREMFDLSLNNIKCDDPFLPEF